MQDIKHTLREIFVQTLRLQADPAQLQETDLIAQLGLDSIAALEIITQVEHRFQITIDDDDISPTLVDSLDTLSAYIAKKRGEG